MWRALDGPLTLAHMTRNLKERMPNMLHENGSAWIVALGSRIQNSLSIKARPVTMHTHKSNNKVSANLKCVPMSRDYAWGLVVVQMDVTGPLEVMSLHVGT